jgi:SAM-dependent methyltransferase
MPGHEAKALATLLAAEGVTPDGQILDVPCGIGRRALGLAEEGFRVTAVDPNEIGVEAARSRVPAALIDRLAFLHAAEQDMPGLPEATRFDAIVSLDHPIGRRGAEDDARFLARLVRHAAPGGRLVLELLHRDFFAPRPKAFAFHVLSDIEQHEFRTFDPVTGVLDLRWTFYHREGDDLRHRGRAAAAMRLVSPHEATALLESAGWRVTGTFGGWSREPVTADRRKIVFVAKPADAAP